MTSARVSKTAEKQIHKLYNLHNEPLSNSDFDQFLGFDSDHFKSKLRQLRINLQLTQKELGDLLGKSNSTVAEWENQSKPAVVPTIDQMFNIARVLSVNVSELMGVNTTDYTHNGLSWRQDVPRHLNPVLQEQMHLAIQALHYLVRQKASEEQLPDKLGGIDMKTIREYLRYAFRQNILSITDVALREDLSKELLYLYGNYGLRGAVVVDTCGPIQNNVIRAEMVAFATARHVLDQYAPTVSHVGLGDGYTVNRSISLILPAMKLHQLKVTPLVMPQETNKVNWDTAMLNATIFQSQMYGAILAAPQQSEILDIEEAQHELNQYARRLDLILVTPRSYLKKSSEKSRWDLSYLDEDNELTSNGTAVDMSVSTSDTKKLQEYAEILHQTVYEDHFASSPDSDNHTAAYSLRNLRATTAARHHVWMAASQMSKAKGVALALKHRLVNGIVIDSEIAEYLLRTR